MVTKWPWLVIGCWALLALALPQAFPSMTEMSERHPLAILPADAPSTATAREISRTFKDAGSENVLIVVLTNPKGMSPANEDVYRTLADRLRRDTADVVMVQDFLSTPELRQDLVSKDQKAWILPVGLIGELGTPQAYAAYTRVSDIVKHSIDGTGLGSNLTGPAATVADLTVAGATDRLPIELAIGILLLLILGVIYRKPATMMLPLLVIGASLLTAQAVVAAISFITGMAISNQTIVFMSALMAGTGTDYAVFLVSRYHDYVRSGDDSDLAARRGLASIGKVIAASAATVGITFLGMGFAKLGVFSTVGVALAVGVGIAFLAAITLLPAILVLAGRRGWVSPRAELASQFWRRSGIRVVRRPKAYLVTSLVILLALASCASLIKFNYDDRKQLPDSSPSSVGYAALEKHFPVNQTIPEYLLITSPNDLRTPRALADLEQMALRVSQVPGVAMVRGVTRPTGESLEQARATYQAGQVGNQLGGASTLISGSTNDLNRLASGAGQMADGLGAVRNQVNGSVGSVKSLLDSLASIQNQFGGASLGQLADAATIIKNVRAIGDVVKRIFGQLASDFSWLDPVVASLDSSPMCSSDAACTAARTQFAKVRDSRDDGSLNKLTQMGDQLQNAGPLDKLSTTIEGLTQSLTATYGALNKLGLTDPRSARATVGMVQQRAGDLAGASRQIADGVSLLVDQTKRMGLGLNEASSFLMSMGQNASDPSMSGFNVPPEVLATEQFKKLAQIFVSPDGHSVRYFIQTNLNPFSTEAMDQVKTIQDAAKSAQPNTSLSDARIAMAGYPVTLRDTRDYYDRDLRLIVLLTVVVVLLILMVLLRAVVGPLYLVGSVILSYLSAMGIGVLFFQVLLGQQLHWSIPGLAFVVLVAVGADYNMLLASRLREESSSGFRSGVIRTVRSTGGVITAAGVIFAASMFGLLFATIGVVVQGGFVIGVGILVDTFLVRTITVPAIAALLGRATWWPSSRPPEVVESVDAPPEERRNVFDAARQS